MMSNPTPSRHEPSVIRWGDRVRASCSCGWEMDGNARDERSPSGFWGRHVAEVVQARAGEAFDRRIAETTGRFEALIERWQREEEKGDG